LYVALTILVLLLLQAQMASILLGFNSCVTSISRLYSRPELVSEVLGAKTSDLQEATPLAELIIAGDLEELVGFSWSDSAHVAQQRRRRVEGALHLWLSE
jgi:hypothetical protein